MARLVIADEQLTKVLSAQSSKERLVASNIEKKEVWLQAIKILNLAVV